MPRNRFRTTSTSKLNPKSTRPRIFTLARRYTGLDGLNFVCFPYFIFLFVVYALRCHSWCNKDDHCGHLSVCSLVTSRHLMLTERSERVDLFPGSAAARSAHPAYCVARKCRTRLASCVGSPHLPLSAVAAAERRRLQHGARSCPSISAARRALSSKPRAAGAAVDR